jgi:hypothetical protein
MENGADNSPDTSGEGKWLTYDEIAQLRGIGRESAIKLVHRTKWRRQKGNDGSARILVPQDWLNPSTRKRSSDNSSGHSPEFSRAIKAFEGGLAAFREQLEAERQRAEKAEEGRDVLREELDQFWRRGRFKRALAAWRGR